MPSPAPTWPVRTALLRRLVLIVTGLALTACGTGHMQHEMLELSGPSMGTTYSIKVVDPPAHLHRDTLMALVEAELNGLLQKLSTYDPASELSRFNQRRETDWIDASTELVEVLTEARQVSELTGGAFDVTVGPLVDLWGFGPELTGDRIPTDAEIEARRVGLGFRNIEVRTAPPAIRKLHPDTRIDLSAIAKGYAVDRLALLLESRGIASYLVEIGGELRGRGHNQAGDHWRIGIERPSAGERAVHDAIRIDNVGVATSGDYRNYFEQDGQRFAHTIDPHTGRPATHRLAAVTVISPQTMRADAMATALMVLGPDAGYTLADREGLAALFIVRSADGFVDRYTPAYRTHRIERKT